MPEAVRPRCRTAYGTKIVSTRKNAVLNTSCVSRIGRRSAWRATNARPSVMSRSGLRSACLGRGFSCKPASSMTATSDRPAAAAKAVPAPTEPIKAPPMAGPPVKASVRASSMRALAAGSAVGGTRLGTNAGVATLYATVPQAASAPRKASSGHVTRPDCTKHRMARSDAARSPSDQTIRRGREMRSASRPAGIAKSRKGRVSAICNSPTSASRAPSAITATMAAAASAICSADCAARFDQASRTNAEGRWAD